MQPAFALLFEAIKNWWDAHPSLAAALPGGLTKDESFEQTQFAYAVAELINERREMATNKGQYNRVDFMVHFMAETTEDANEKLGVFMDALNDPASQLQLTGARLLILDTAALQSRTVYQKTHVSQGFTALVGMAKFGR